MKRGIAVAGTILVDVVKMIDAYPQKGRLVDIKEICKAVGGCVPNTAIDLAIIDPDIPVSALGAVGDDENGRFVTAELAVHGVRTAGVRVCEGEQTGFTDVMTITGSGERTFFTLRGANALFDFDKPIEAEILHVGYLTLMDRLDRSDEAYGTVLARRLHEAQQAGIKTSIDLVSSGGDGFAATVMPALRYCDYAVMNEIEACCLAGLPARDAGGALLTDNVHAALEKLLQTGVRAAAVVHCPEAGFLLTPRGNLLTVPSLSLPKGYIKGSVGAGDAFCAACLYGFYKGCEGREILSFASAAAACNLGAADAVSGMRSKAEIMALERAYQRRTL